MMEHTKAIDRSCFLEKTRVPLSEEQRLNLEFYLDCLLKCGCDGPVAKAFQRALLFHEEQQLRLRKEADYGF